MEDFNSIQSNPEGEATTPSGATGETFDEFNRAANQANVEQRAKELKEQAIVDANHPEGTDFSNDTVEGMANQIGLLHPDKNEQSTNHPEGTDFSNNTVEGLANQMGLLHPDENEQPIKTQNQKDGELTIDHPAESQEGPQTEAPAELETEPQVESVESDHTAETKPESEIKPEPEIESEPESEVKPESEPESEVEPESEIREDNRETGEKSRAEKRLESLKTQIEEINQEIIDTNSKKENLDEQIFGYERALDNNFSEQESLLEKLADTEKVAKQTKINLIKGFTSGLKIAKKLMLGKHEEARKLIDNLKDNVDKNEQALEDHAKIEDELDAKENEKSDINAVYGIALDDRKNCINKLSRLEHQKAELSKRINLLREEVANESWADAWEKAREDVETQFFKEAGAKNANDYRRKLDQSRENIESDYKEDLSQLEKYKNPSRIDLLMQSEEELERNKARAGEVEQMLQQAYENNLDTINQNRETVDQVFPTLPELIKNIRENHLVRGALSTLKRKILMRVYGIS